MRACVTNPSLLCQNFDSEICGVVSDAVWDSREKQQQILQMAIVEHLYQQGMLSVAEELCQVMLALRAQGHLSPAV